MPGVEVDHRVPAIARAAEQEPGLEIEVHHRVFRRVQPREEAVEEAAAEALVGDPAV